MRVRQRLHLILWCLASGVLALAALRFWSERNAPLHTKLERLWTADIEYLEASGRLPPQWFKAKEISIEGGTPETRKLLEKVTVPLRPDPINGQHKLDVLVVAWTENGKRGVLVQHNLMDGASGNMILELGRTYILSPVKTDLWQDLMDSLRQ